MTRLMNPFDPKAFDPSQGGSQLPIGRHPVVIAGSEIKANKNNDGGFLELTLRITDGPMQGTTGAHRLNLYHNSATTVEIANRQLSAICHAVGVFQLGADGCDVSVLHNIPFLIDVAYQKGQEPGVEGAKGYTEVRKVFDINGNEPGKAPVNNGAAAQPVQQQQQPANTGFAQQQQQQAPAQGGWGAPTQQQQPVQQQQQPVQNGWQQGQAQGNAPWNNK